MEDKAVGTSDDPERDLHDSSLICWGCGEFGQHSHGIKNDVPFDAGAVHFFTSHSWADRVKLVSCGSSHTVAVTNANEVYVWGNSNSGQLGCGDVDTKWQPQKIELLPLQSNTPKVVCLSCGGRHTMVVLENGNVISFGNNFYAQLGYDFKTKNYKENQLRPKLLHFLTYRPVKEVGCGDKHTVFLFKDGTVATLGNNHHGQLGSGSRDEAVVPKYLELVEPIKQIAAGANHNLALTVSGRVYIWGYGKACHNQKGDVLRPESIRLPHNNIIQVTGGSTHSLVLTASGNVYSWGSGADGQLGHGEKIRSLHSPKKICHSTLRNRVVQLACGESYSAAITDSGELYLWGRNSHTIDSNLPNSYKQFEPRCIADLGRTVKHVACGAWHAAALTGPPEVSLSECGDVSMEDEDMLYMETGIPVSSDNTQAEDDGWSVLSEEGETVVSIPTAPGWPLQHENTTLSLADFYAPTPDITTLTNGPLSARSCHSRRTNGHGRVKNAKSPLPNITLNDSTLQYENGAQNDEVIENNETKFDSEQIVSDLSGYKLEERDWPDLHSQSMEIIGFPIHASEQHPFIAHKSLSPVPIREPKQMPETTSELNPIPTFQRSRTRHHAEPSLRVKQVSKSTADKFVLPRESSVISSKHVDFVPLHSLGTLPMATRTVPGGDLTREKTIHSNSTGEHQYMQVPPIVPSGNPHVTQGNFPKRRPRLPSPKKYSPQNEMPSFTRHHTTICTSTNGTLGSSKQHPPTTTRSPSASRIGSSLLTEPKSHVSSIPSGRSVLGGGDKLVVISEEAMHKPPPVYSSATSWRDQADLNKVQKSSNLLHQRDEMLSKELANNGLSGHIKSGGLHSGHHQSHSMVSELSTSQCSKLGLLGQRSKTMLSRTDLYRKPSKSRTGRSNMEYSSNLTKAILSRQRSFIISTNGSRTG